jgi:hypothetical protein
MEGREGGNVKGLTKGFPLIAAAVLLFPAAQAAKLPGLEMLPDETRYIECVHDNCSFTELEYRMQADVRTRLDGTYAYVLGNVDAGVVRTYSISWARAWSHMDWETKLVETEPELLHLQQVANPAGFDAEFGAYAITMKDPPVISIPPGVAGTMPTNVAGLGDVSHYLRGLPQFNNIFVGLSRPTVKVVFQDGSSAKFQYMSPFISTGLSWVYVLGSAVDGDGYPIAVGDTATSQQGPYSGGGGTSVNTGSVGSGANSSVTVYGPVFNLDGAARITVITVGGGPGEGPERQITCINNICIGS